MKNRVSKILGLFLTTFMLFSLVSPMSVFAVLSNADTNVKVVKFVAEGVITSVNIGKNMGANESSKTLKKGNIEWNTNTLSVNNKGKILDLITVNDGEGEIYINPSAFREGKNSDVTSAMKLFVDALSDCGGNADTVQQIMADIQDVDSSVSSIMLPLIFESTKGDMFTAYKITSPFLNLLSIGLGVGAVLLILLLLFSTVMDLAYIGLPVWREAQASKEGNNGKGPFGVSYEALTTVKEVEQGFGSSGGGEYRNAYLMYFKRRALTYIILAICIMYLICGGLSGIIGFVLNLVSGITG